MPSRLQYIGKEVSRRATVALRRSPDAKKGKPDRGSRKFLYDDIEPEHVNSAQRAEINTKRGFSDVDRNGRH